MPLFRFAHSWHSFMTTRISRKIFYGHRHNILFGISGIRKNLTFSGSLSEVKGHNDEAYPHYHHVISRHRPHRTRKSSENRKISDKAGKMPTIPDRDDDEFPYLQEVTSPSEDENADEKKKHLSDDDEPKSKKLFTIGHGESETEMEMRQMAKKSSQKKRRKHHSHHRM